MIYRLHIYLVCIVYTIVDAVYRAYDESMVGAGMQYSALHTSNHMIMLYIHYILYITPYIVMYIGVKYNQHGTTMNQCGTTCYI